MAKPTKRTVVKREDKTEVMNFKTEVMNFRVTPKEREIIERQAEADGMSVAQYLRVAVLMDMSLSGNVEAMKIVFSSVSEGIKESVRSKLLDFEGSRSELDGHIV